MSGVTVVKQVVAEVRGKTDQLERDMAVAEQRLGRTKKSLEGNANAAGALGNQYGAAARQIASATEQMARTGAVTGEASKQIVAAGSQIALSFGPASAVVGALGIFGLAAFEAFRRASNEAKAAREEFEKTQRAFVQNRDLGGAARQVTRLLGGDAESEDPNRQAGLLRLRERLARERQQLLESAPAPGVRQTAQQLTARRDAIQAVRDLEAAVASLDAEYRVAETTYTQLATQDVERQQNLKRLKADEEAAGDAAKTRAKDVVEAQRLITEAVKSADAALAAFDREAASFGQAFEQTLLRELGSSVDLVRAEFDALIDEGVRLNGENDPRVLLLRGLRDAAVEAATAIEASQDVIRTLELDAARGGAVTQETFGALDEAARGLQSTLDKLTPKSKAYLAVQQELLRVEQRRRQLLEGVADANNDGGAAPAPADTTQNAAAFAREIQQAVDGALQLAQAFGEVDAKAVQILRSIGQIAGNLPALSAALTAGSGLGVVGAALPIAGALASLFAASPEDRARAEALERNTEAIRELTRRAGLLGIDVSGAAAGSARDGIQRILDRTGVQPDGRIVSISRELRDQILRESGTSFAELERLAQSLGLTFDGTRASFEALQAALADTITKLGEFGTDLQSAQRQAQAEIELFGITDPLKQLALRNQARAGRSSALDGVTAGLDLSTTEGREQARKNAQALFDLLKAGGDTLSAGALGSLTGDELLEAILDLVRSLNSVDESLGVNTTTATRPDQVVVAERTQITADQASRLLGLSASQLTELRLIREALIAAQSPIPLPSAETLGTARGASVSVVQNIEITVQGDAVSGLAAATTQLSETALQQLVELISRRLGTSVRVKRQYAGEGVLS